VNPVVWITRPQPAAQRTCARLRASGYRALDIPLLEIAFERGDPVPDGPWPDLVILVSANAAEGFLRTWTAGDLPRAPETPDVAVVGERTRERLAESGRPFRVIAVGEDGESLGVDLARRGIDGRRIWIAAGDREGSGRTFLPEFLGMAGAKVSVFGVYRNRDREPSPEERVVLGEGPAGAAVLHSPSAADAFRRVTGDGSLAFWWTAPVVALGPTTGRRLAELGCPRYRLAPLPSDDGILRALAGFANLSPAGGTES